MSITRRLIYIIIVLFLLTLSFVSAEGIDETEPQIVVEDALGRRVELLDVPSRIVMAGRAVIMLSDALYLFEDVAERVVAVGVTDQGLGDFLPVIDPEAGTKSYLGKSAGPEEILARKPDLVILKSYLRDSLGKPIEISGVPVIYLDLETPEQYNRDLRILGTVLKQEERAQELISMFDRRASRLRELTAGIEERRVALFQFGAREQSYTFSVPPAGWIQGTIVELAGGEPVWYGSAPGSGWNQVQFEQIALWNPDVIVFVSYRSSSAEALELIRSDPLWQGLEAVRNGEVYAMPADYYSWGQPDPRWILAAEWMARVLHPGLFQGSFSDSVQLFFSDFYGITEESYRKQILPRIEGDLFD
jgi:iron complex transport system substrate-binding protein